MSEVNISDIREVLRNLVDGNRFTFAQVARETGLSTGVVSGFMNNKYAGDN
ncbi:TPA: DNA transposition protein, partial [Klebsiella oxytoca]|nr:DNA transposition protein [Klebsiella oxytoca]